MRSLIQPRGCIGGRDHSTGFVQSKPSIMKFLVVLGKVKDTISIDNMTQKLHLYYFIIISLLGIVLYLHTNRH
jgi:hypothetical protein